MPHPFRKLVIECDRCHRPVAELGDFGQMLTTVHSEAGERESGGILGPNAERQSAEWSTRVVDVDPTHDPADGPRHNGRFKLICVHRPGVPRAEQPVTADALHRAYERAVRAGRTRIGMREIR